MSVDRLPILRELGALAGMVSAALALRREGKEIGPHEKASIREAGNAGYRRQPSPDAVRLVQAMRRATFRALDERLTEYIKRVLKALDDPILIPRDLDREFEITELDVCQELNSMRHLNGGRFADGQYEEWWKDFNCEGRAG